MVKINNGSAEEQVKANNALSILNAAQTPATEELNSAEAAKILKTVAESRAVGSRDEALPYLLRGIAELPKTEISSVEQQAEETIARNDSRSL